MPENINPDTTKWTCSSCLGSSYKHIGANGIMPNAKPMGGLPNLIGKRPQNNISEEDPDPSKRLNIGINGRNFF